MAIKVTNHAIDRYIERTGDCRNNRFLAKNKIITYYKNSNRLTLKRKFKGKDYKYDGNVLYRVYGELIFVTPIDNDCKIISIYSGYRGKFNM